MGEQVLESLFSLSQVKSEQMHFVSHAGNSVYRLGSCVQIFHHLQYRNKKVQSD